jgi:integrase
VKATVREATLDDYENTIGNHLVPAFGHMRVRDITRGDVEAFRNRTFGKEYETPSGWTKKLGARMANKAVTMASMMFRHAIETRAATHNPAARVGKVQTAESPQALLEGNVLNPEESGRLLEACDERWRPLVMTAIYTGLREGELLGLYWTDIELDTGKLYVRRTYSSGRFGEPKSRAGRRRIDLPATLVAELRRWKMQCPKPEEGDRALVFPSIDGTPLSTQNMVTRAFYPALRRAGLRQIRFHDLRHTTASLLLHGNVQIKRVQQIMGHADARITLNTYGHLIPDVDDGAADRLEELIA